ncbi:MAG TPA: class I SAM-dependent methyltransferase [Acidimicrobiales bacterium]|nr:class I SAM-dependent methyltransferase [Acidimicrobiales bacterium]
MRIGLRDLRNTAEDAIGATYRGLSAAQWNYLERRRRRGESVLFSDTFARASFIGGWLARDEAELLFEIAGAVPAGHDIVEIGSYLGRSTAFLATGAGPGATVHAVDPHTSGCLQLGSGEGIDTSKQFQRNVAKVGVEDRVEAHITVSVDAARSYQGRPVGLLFVDGNHSEKAVLDDGREWSPHMAPGSFIAFDDISWHGVASGVQRLVAEGVVAPIAGRVGKIGLCGPAERWPARVRAIVRPYEPAGGRARTFLRGFVPFPKAHMTEHGPEGDPVQGP